ncbi:hypothetical protein BGX28_008220 [Mortierella sp. GBA30]|nr:hypothetical protein BGX28_008220 [Mortierella sp. GBA30]
MFLSAVRRSASSGPLATQVLTMAKTNNVNALRSSIWAAARRFQSASTASSDNMAYVDASSIVYASSMDRVDLANGSFFALHHSVSELTRYMSSLTPFTPPSMHQSSVEDRQIERMELSVSSIDGNAPIQSIMDELEETNVMHMTSVLRKRRIKMRKHKYKKLRKRTRALRKKLGK